MTIADLVRALESIAPPELAEAWDNVGLLVGDPAAGVAGEGPVLATIDLDEPVLDEAIEMNARLIVAYHPVLFAPVKRLTTASATGRILMKCVQHGVAVYSPHTALDAAAGGVADWLLGVCAGAGSADGGVTRIDSRAALTGAAMGGGGAFKVAVFVPVEPPEVLVRVRDAMAGAGAGRIGAYDTCSFRTMGVGSFRGDATSNPAVGVRGRLESVEEHKLEMVCPGSALPAVIAAIRGAHPYEEPAFDVYAMTTPARTDLGAGRVGTLATPVSVSDLAARVKRGLGVHAAQYAAAGGDPARRVSRVAVCPGSGASLLDAAAAAGAEVFVTGEMKHHEVRGALERGISIVLAGHTETERGYLPVLARKLETAAPGVKVMVSRVDRAPLAWA